MNKIERTRETRNRKISDDVLVFFYEKFEDTVHDYYSLISKDNLYDLPNLIVTLTALSGDASSLNKKRNLSNVMTLLCFGSLEPKLTFR
jgi:hypothetical protein